MHDGLLQIHPPQHHPHNRGISEETADGDYFDGISAKPMDIPAGARRGETVRVASKKRSGDTVSVDTAVANNL